MLANFLQHLYFLARLVESWPRRNTDLASDFTYPKASRDSKRITIHKAYLSNLTLYQTTKFDLSKLKTLADDKIIVTEKDEKEVHEPIDRCTGHLDIT